MNGNRSTRLLAAAALAMALGGCSLLGGSKEPATIYAPMPRVQADPAWPRLDAQLAIGTPHVAGMLDGVRIAVRPVPGELQVYKGALWAKDPGEQLRDAVLATLEESGKVAAVARQGSGIAADFRLELDVRRFEADYAGGAVPAATLEVNAKLLRSVGQSVVASRTFRRSVPAGGTDTALVTRAFGEALGAIAGDISGWALATGSGNWDPSRPPASPR
jgi:cholesterol transport system auxiliary component